MIIFAIALFLALVSIIYVSLRMTNRVPPLSNGVEKAALICAVAGGVTAIVMGLVAFAAATQGPTNFKEYETLILYRDVVEDSHDELLRWDFYERVENWNDRYEQNLKNRDNPWYSMLFPESAFEGCDIVTFELRRS